MCAGETIWRIYNRVLMVMCTCILFLFFYFFNLRVCVCVRRKQLHVAYSEIRIFVSYAWGEPVWPSGKAVGW